MKSFNSDKISAAIDGQTTLFWFRRDLRLNDNAGLYHALKENRNVLPVFIFDTEILDNLGDRQDSRVEFILRSLEVLQSELKEIGSSLLVLHGNPVSIFTTIHAKSVYTNRDYEPYAIARDKSVSGILENKNIPFKTFKDQVIFEKDEIVKDNGKPYTVFTPYSKQWKIKLNEFYLKPYPVRKYFSSFKVIKPLPFPTLKDLNFQHTGIEFPPRIVRKSIIVEYEKKEISRPFMERLDSAHISVLAL